MNNINAARKATAPKLKAAPAPLSLESARYAYLASKSRIDLASLIKRFENAPADVEVCGELKRAK